VPSVLFAFAAHKRFIRFERPRAATMAAELDAAPPAEAIEPHLARLAHRLIIDSHCHVHEEFQRESEPHERDDDDDTEPASPLPAPLLRPPFRRTCLVAVLPFEWRRVLQIQAAAERGRVMVALGLHPWHAHRFVTPTITADEAPPYLALLRHHLERTPSAVVGEIGLDKAAKDRTTGRCEFQSQTRVFNEQFHLATELQRPCVIVRQIHTFSLSLSDICSPFMRPACSIV